MPSNSNTDKQNDNLEQASKADKKFIAFKKRMLWLGIFFLIAAIVLSLPNYFFLETSNNILGVGIFSFVVLADIFILLPAIITKETNWLALLCSTILCIVFLCLSVFYPFQDFQYRLKVVSLVAIVATLLFVLLNSWINAAFFPSKNANIRQSVDFSSNRFAVDVLNVTLILGSLFGTIAFLYFYPDKDNSTFFGGIDIKNVALATAGLVTFFWAAKATKNKSIDLEQKKREFVQRKQEFEQKKLEFEEKKQDGKRHDNEIAMAKQRDTAQLIAEASKLLSSENDSQKYAGLSFLNAVASDPEGPFRKEAFDLIADFITSASDITTENKVRMRALMYLDDQIGNKCHKFTIDEFISLSGSSNDINKLERCTMSYQFNNLIISYENFFFTPIYRDFKFPIFTSDESKEWLFYNPNVYKNCRFSDFDSSSEDRCLKILNVSNCVFERCKIFLISPYAKVEGSSVIPLIIQNTQEETCKFKDCDFSGCPNWSHLRNSHRKKESFSNCYFFADRPPTGYDEETMDKGVLIKLPAEKRPKTYDPDIMVRIKK